MKLDLRLRQYIGYKVYKVMQINEKYGYRVRLEYMEGPDVVQQKSGFLTEKEANEAREKTIGELFAGTYIVYADVRVGEFLEYWLEEDFKKRTQSNATFDTFKRNIKNHILPALGKEKMSELKRVDIQQYYNMKSEYSKSVAQMSKTILNISLRYAVDKNIIPENPAEGVTLPKNACKKKFHSRNIDLQKTLTLEQILSLIKASRNTPIHMQILFNVLMGLRRGEIIGVKYSDVNYIDRTLKVQRQLGIRLGSEKEEYDPKIYTKQEIGLKTWSSYRELPIPDYVFEAILEQRKKYEKQRSILGKEFQDLDYICCSNFGWPRSKDYHWKYYKKLLAECNLPDIRWHDLRATFCTLLLKNDFNPKAVSKLMGHSKEIITMDVYGDNRNIIADCADDLQPFIEEVMPDKTGDKMKNRMTEDIVINADEYMPKDKNSFRSIKS